MNQAKMIVLAREIKRLSLYKWQLIIDNHGSDNKIRFEPSLKDLPEKCSFCSLWVWAIVVGKSEESCSGNEYQRCLNCPLIAADRGGCCRGLHGVWSREKQPALKAAAASDVYNYIKKVTLKAIVGKMQEGYPEAVRKYTPNCYFEVTLNSAYEMLITKPKE